MPAQRSAKSAYRSADTRERLLRAGLEAFGVHGYEGVSTRQLANLAGVNLAAIPYHFGGKEGMYLAVAEDIAERIGERIRGQAEAIGADLESGRRLSQKRLLGHLQDLLEALAGILLGSPDAYLWAGIILREQMYPTAAFDILYQNAIGRVHAILSLIISRLLQRPDGDPDCTLRAHAVIGEVVIFRAARAAILRRMEWDDYNPERVHQITQLLFRQTCDMLLAERRRERSAK
jgi:AcrR family transcriptional regulator